MFEICRKYGISLNPKKSIFTVTEGNFLGFIVSKEGMIINPKCTKSISKIGLPGSRKAMQSFLGKINFVPRFVPNFSQVVKPLQDLVKKDVQFKWFEEQRNSFVEIRRAIVEAPSLRSLDFSKYFILYTFATDFSYAAVLTQKNHEDTEIPIYFMRSRFKGS